VVSTARPVPRGPSVWETWRRLRPRPFEKLAPFLFDTVRTYGDVVAFNLPWRRFVVLNDPALIKAVLVTEQHAFVKSRGVDAMRSLLGDGLLTSEEPKHRTMRRIVQPAFHRDRIVGYARKMQRHADDFADSLHAGQTLDLHAAMTELTLRIASTTLFGTDAGDEAVAVRDALHETMKIFPIAVGPFGELMARLPFPSTRRFAAARARLDAIVYGLIARRRADPAAHDDALSLLLAAEDAETGFRPDDTQIRDEAMTLMLAGHETTANALTWTLYSLARNPKSDAALGAEAARAPSDLAAAFETLDVARRTLQEGMRLYPPAWIIGRRALRDVTVGDYAIPVGTAVLMSPLILHRSVSYYANPETFDPDRWLTDDAQPFAYIPFGGGARKCIGDAFAWTEGTIVLAALARRFRFTLVNDAPLEPEFLVTMRPRGPVMVRVETR
jgi:cytochrome P450